MPRLKSRTKWPPGGFSVLHPETGMTEPFSGSFENACDFELTWRRRNPALSERLNLPPDPAHVEAWVDEQNALRCLAGGFTTFVDISGTPEALLSEAQKKTLFGRVAGVVGSSRAALSAYKSMFGTQGPAPRSDAERRSAICADCPKNDTETDVVDYFVESAAGAIRGILSALRDLDMTVPDQDRLGICTACDCPIKSKVWTRLPVILPHVTPEIERKLAPQCWITAERTAERDGRTTNPGA